jgi:hypothetical protein
MTNLLDEAKCCEVIRQLRWPEGVVRLRRGGADIFNGLHFFMEADKLFECGQVFVTF